MIHKYLNKFFKNHASPWLVLCIDVLMSILAYVMAYFIRFELSILVDMPVLLAQTTLMTVLVLCFFFIFKPFKGVIREATVKDASKILYTTFGQLLSALLLVTVIESLDNFEALKIPRSIIIINFLVLTVMMVLSRFVFKYFYNRLKALQTDEINTLIYGAGDSGIMTLQAIQNDIKSPYKVVGFLDDDKRKTKKKINQISIFNGLDITEAFLTKYDIKTIIISIQNISNTNLIKLTDRLLGYDVNVNIVPPVSKWLEGKLQTNQIRPLAIEDLLNRAPIALENPKVASHIQGKRVLITGAAGSIGSELVKQVSDYAYEELILIDQAESPLYEVEQELKRMGKLNVQPFVMNICDASSMAVLFKTYQPDIVIHAAAYKHVPLMEQSPYQAVKTNIEGTKIVADLALANAVGSFILVSTDKAVNPTNVMGATKRASEIYLSALSQKQSSMKITITRFGNVLGSNGSVIPLFKRQLKQGGPLTVTHKDIIRYFMTIPEACSLILEASSMGKGGEIYVFDMGEPVRIFDLAKRMIELSGFSYPHDIDIVVSGLRPGEKLYEELLADKEQTLPTYHSKIKIAQTQSLDFEAVLSDFHNIINENTPEESYRAVIALKALIPEYQSQNSVWQQYDSKIQAM